MIIATIAGSLEKRRRFGDVSIHARASGESSTEIIACVADTAFARPLEQGGGFHHIRRQTEPVAI